VLHGGPSGWWEVARDASSVRAVFDGLGGEGLHIKAVEKIAGRAYQPKVYDVSNIGKTKPNFQIVRQRGGGVEYAALLAIVVASAMTLVAIYYVVQYVILTLIPELES
jgi:hypothetical protein